MELGKMQHPVDGRVWKNFNTKYPNFAKELRNVRLGLAADGVTIDVTTGQKFNMRAMALWTINDFSARSSLFGWSGQGYKACPTYNEDTPSVRVLEKIAYVGHRRFLKKPYKWRRSLEFNGEKEDEDPPREFGRDQIQAQLARLPTRVKAKLEGLIAKGYVAEEALTFSSYYFWDVTMKFNRPDHNVDCPPPTCQFQVFRSVCKSTGLQLVIRLDHQELKKVIWYVLHNSPKIDTYRVKFKRISRLVWVADSSTSRRKDPGVNAGNELFALACGPTLTPISVNSCVVNNVRFVVHNHDERCTTQNNGIRSPGEDEEMYYDIIDVDEDDDIIDDEHVLPHDLVDSDDEDLINVDDDDGVMSADVARGHSGDGGGDNRPLPHQIASCCLGSGKGTRKPNLRGRKVGKMHYRKETRNQFDN
ncbi:reverse transcriptase domain-containing protein [Tanacetum coccineum]